MLKAVELAKDQGADIIIISDANTFFINSVLEYHSILGLFSEIITNQANVNDNGFISLTPRSQIAHNCPNKCAKNLCKGKEITTYLDLNGQKYSRIVYLGDGKNDYCPSTKLSSHDFVFARKKRALEKILKSDESSVVANIRFWDNAEDILKLFSKEIFTSCSAMVHKF
ncbi:hypothetical protein HK096_005534 [Nowakowskiella sp. JEL0078]|nr:hypothetical protein HK096_005534 [Nowakowskiella sp. JEL0078]